MKIVTVIGARPQLIKVALLSRELKKHFDELIVHTGQHYDYEMSKVFFEQLTIPEPDYNLGVKEENEIHQIRSMMIKLEKIFLTENPGLIMLIGDTNSTLAAALTASRLGLKCAHLEAGTRMFDKKVPEEINRIVADNVSDLLFCPSLVAVNNLKREGFSSGVYFTGDVMIDLLLSHINSSKKSRILNKLGLKKEGYVLATIHRQKNTNNKNYLLNILDGLVKSGKKIVIPLHPRTRKFLERYNRLGYYERRLMIIEPVGYIDMISLEKNAEKIVTDSGGVQKEAYYLKVPCVTLDNSTGWPETVKDGWNILTGANMNKIISALENFYPNSNQKNYYGKGDAIKKISYILRHCK